MSNSSKLVRLQKFIADCGVTSRRKAEALIEQGKVSVNGKVITEQGVKVDPTKDAIDVEGQFIDQKFVQKLYLVMNKPRGFMTTVSDPEGRKTVMDLCQEISERIYPVGRLDYLSEGLLILTNDGELAQKIIHPSSNIDKVYEVKVFGAVNETILKKLRQGVHADGSLLKPISVRIIGQLPTKTWLEFHLSDGKNREIRKICEGVGLTIDKLKRVAIGNLSIDGIGPGSYHMYSKNQLLAQIGWTEKSKPTKYRSAKKTISLRKKGFQQSTLADDERFQILRKETYFTSLAEIKKSKQAKEESQA